MNQLRIHYFEHVPFEGPGCIEGWAKAKGHLLTGTRLHQGDNMPAIEAIDWLVVMGGPMSVHDEESYPWLRAEKVVIKAAIDQGKVVIGICLGAQLIAHVLGAKVYPNPVREIGWFPVRLSTEAQSLPWFADMPEEVHVFHWHSDTFDLPQESMHLAYSEACHNQAFIYRHHVLGLQFHFEVNETSVLRMLHHCEEDLEKDVFVQTANTIFRKSNFRQCNQLLWTLLERMAQHTHV